MERLPWHDALYFVTTTLTTVGYGDVVVHSPLGKLAVLVMMAVGVVLIPLRTSQLHSQMVNQRVLAGARRPGGPAAVRWRRTPAPRAWAHALQPPSSRLAQAHHSCVSTLSLPPRQAPCPTAAGRLCCCPRG
jgi:hypothetical protein